MYDLFTKYYLLNLKQDFTSESHTKNVRISKCAFYECKTHLIIVLAITNHNLVCYFEHKTLEQNDISSESTQQSSSKTEKLLNYENDAEKVIIKNFPINIKHGTIKDICFDSTGEQLFILLEKGSLIYIPILHIFKTINNGKVLDTDASFVLNGSIVAPTVMTAWYSLDGMKEIIIIGNKQGLIYFIDVENKKITGKANINGAVKFLRIIRDKFTVTLLITAHDNSQWRLPLEENRLSVILNQDNDIENIKFMEENKNKLFSCLFNFQTYNSSIDEKMMNLKPLLILEKFSYSTDELNCFLTNQQSLILDIRVLENRIASVNIFEGNEYTYEPVLPLSKYNFPLECIWLHDIKMILTERVFITASKNDVYIISKQFSHPYGQISDNSIMSKINFKDEILAIYRTNEIEVDSYLEPFIVITSHDLVKVKPKISCEQMFVELAIQNNSNGSIIAAEKFAFMLRMDMNSLYEKIADHYLQNRKYQKALEFYHNAKTSKLKRVLNFISYGYITEVINLIEYSLNEQSFDLEENEKLQFSNIYATCLIQKVLEKNLLNDKQKHLVKLEKFILQNTFYDETYVINLLIESCFFELASSCADVRCSHACLIENFLNAKQLQCKLLGKQLYDFIDSSDYGDILHEPYKSEVYYKVLLNKNIIQGFFLNPFLIARYLKLLVETLPSLSSDLIKKAAELFDPRKPEVQLLMNNVMDKLNQQYMQDETDETSVEKKDIINYFIFVVLILIKNTGTFHFNKKIFSILNEKKEKENVICFKNKKLETIDKNYTVYAGQTQSFMIKNMTLYFWGKSKLKLNLSTNDIELSNNCKDISPKFCTFFTKNLPTKVLSVACGVHHSLILTNSGCFAIGQSGQGQLGCGQNIQFSKQPILIKRLARRNIISIACGQYHSLAIDDKGRLYSWGWGIHGQLGHENTETLFKPKLVSFFKNISIKSVCGGYCHSLALDEFGTVYSFGNNLFGQLGIENVFKLNIPQQITQLKEPIKLLASKYFHSVAVTENNEIFTWGSNPQNLQLKAQQLRKARLINPEDCPPMTMYSLDHLTPKLVEICESLDIIKVDAGNMHSLLLTKCGKVYSWGRGPEGQLGQGWKKEFYEPTHVTNLHSHYIIDIACGLNFSLAVNMNGELFAWGQNLDFQLGYALDASSNGIIDLKTFENRKYRIKPNNKMISYFPSKHVERYPIKIKVADVYLKYYYMDSFSEENLKESIRSKRLNKGKYTLDQYNLCRIIYNYRHELDLQLILNSSLSFQNYICTAFVHEILKNFNVAIEYCLKSILENKNIDSDSTKKQIEFVLYHYVSKTLNVDSIQTRYLLNKFLITCCSYKVDPKLLECIVLNVFDKKFKHFIFGTILFETIDEYNLESKIDFSNSFKTNLMRITTKYLKSAKINDFMKEPINVLLSSMSANQNSASAEKLWRNILDNIQMQLNKNTKPNNIKENKDCDFIINKEEINDGLEFMPVENEMYIFSCNHYYSSGFFRNILLKQLEVLVSPNDSNNSKMNNLLDDYSKMHLKETINSKCPLCSNY